MFFRLAFLSSALAAAIVVAACDKPSSASPPASPQMWPYDQSADGIVALLMALRRDKRDAPERDVRDDKRSGESSKAKPLAEPEKLENG